MTHMKHIPLSLPRSKTSVVSENAPPQVPTIVRAGTIVTGTYEGVLVEFEVLRSEGDSTLVVLVLGFQEVLCESYRGLTIGEHGTIDLDSCSGFVWGGVQRPGRLA